MRCENIEEYLSDYVEGTLQPALTVPVEAHLDECSACRTAVEDLRSVWALLNDAPVVEPPVSIRPLVWSKIEAAESAPATKTARAGFSFARFFNPLSLAKLAAVLVLVVVGANLAIPGQYRQAGLFFPLNLFGQKAATVTFGSLQAVKDVSGLWIVTSAENKSGVDATVRWTSAGAGIVGASTGSVLVPAGKTVEVRLGTASDQAVSGGAASVDIQLTVQPGGSQSRMTQDVLLR